MHSETIEYQANGLICRGLLCRPARHDTLPAILLAHEAPGLGEHMRRRAAMFAELGFIAFAADLHGEGRLLEGNAARDRMQELQSDTPTLRQLIGAAYGAMIEQPGVDPDRTIAAGYCFGGGAVLELARAGAPLIGVLTYHGWLLTDFPAGAREIGARILAFTGAADVLVTREHVARFEAEMTAAEADWQVVTFGGAGHAFTNRDVDKLGNPALRYDAKADRRSWWMTRFFLDDLLTQT